MIQYQPQPPVDPAIDEALRVFIKVIAWVYLTLAALLALLFGVVIVGVTISYMLLRVFLIILDRMLGKQTGFGTILTGLRSLYTAVNRP